MLSYGCGVTKVVYAGVVLLFPEGPSILSETGASNVYLLRGLSMDKTIRRTTTDFLFARPSFLSGVGRLVDFGCYFDAYNESRSPMEADIRASVSDWLSIGDDLYSAIEVERDRKSVV